MVGPKGILPFTLFFIKIMNIDCSLKLNYWNRGRKVDIEPKKIFKKNFSQNFQKDNLILIKFSIKTLLCGVVH